MHRRGFLLGLASVLAGAGAVGTLFSPAQATVLSQLKGTVPEGLPDLDAAGTETAGTTPDGTPVETTQWGPPGVPPGRRHRRRRRRRVCAVRRDRWGRPVRRCWYVYR
ncbi:hypothetical protein [Ancylobacter vacuolatus]|uniref:Tat (Twin-arginine translocation) pathway signal sequence n=1 Tax=Ancylobacter vacuolatus TaxID=223389 RepID=A0ABU0DEJ3_9HYPH|nr:hypothetical protein [Ancylobacter vacuolatus]MDQ0346849.1 hypothetical protein [Ancylobacter vacuolatus]